LPDITNKVLANQAELIYQLPGTTITKKITGIVEAPTVKTPDIIDIGNTKPFQYIDKDTIFFENFTSEILQISAVISDTTQFKIEGKYTNYTGATKGKGRIKISFTPTKAGISTTLLNIYIQNYETPFSVTLKGYCEAPREYTYKGSVFDNHSFTPNTVLYCKDIQSGILIGTDTINNNKKYSFNFFSERKYMIYNDKDTIYVDLTDLKNNPIDTIINQSFFQFALKKDLNLCLKNILFQSGDSILLSESYQELERVYNILYENPKITIEIVGHTDNEISKIDNLTLSQARANEVKKYLVAKGIDNNRITTNGFGDTQPIANNATEEGKKINRREEILIKNF